MQSISQKTVCITGASAGIGKACAYAFAKESCRLILIARRTERLRTIQKDLEEKFNTDVKILTLDISNQQEVFKQLEAIGPVDILINNAGLALGVDKVFEADPKHMDIMLDTNIKGVLYATRAIVPGMIKRGHGDIINISSIAGHEVYPGGAIYCATKHAVDALTKGLRMDLIDTPLRVSSISPGAVHTEFSTVRLNGDKKAADAFYQGFDPLLAEDMADIAIFNATRPQHVQIADVVVLANAQAAAKMIHKEEN